MPQKPNINNIGVLLGPVLADIIGDTFGAEKILSINSLHSYLDKGSLQSDYMNYISQSGINFDNTFVDIYNIDALKSLIQKMFA